MGLNIKNEDVVSGIRKLAGIRGVSLTDAVDQAVKAALGDEDEARRKEAERRRKVIENVQRRIALLPLRDPRPLNVIMDEIHVYNDQTQAMVLALVKSLVRLGCKLHIGSATIPSALSR